MSSLLRAHFNCKRIHIHKFLQNYNLSYQQHFQNDYDEISYLAIEICLQPFFILSFFMNVKIDDNRIQFTEV